MSFLTMSRALAGAVVFPLLLIALVLVARMGSGKLAMRPGMAWLVVCMSAGVLLAGVGLLLFDIDVTWATHWLGGLAGFIGITLAAMSRAR